MAKSLEQKVQELADREEIKELTARYCWHVQHSEGEAIARLFTDDGLLDAPGNKPVSGMDALLKFYGAITPAESPVPFIHNHIIEIDGDNAQGTCTIDARFTRKGESILGAGWYEDKYRRVNGKWRFAVRKVSFHHSVPLKEGWAKVKAEAAAKAEAAKNAATKTSQ
jgi:ketosteroid isomerase-like protein